MIWKMPSTYNTLTFDLRTPCPFHLLFQKERKHPPCFFFFFFFHPLYLTQTFESQRAHTYRQAHTPTAIFTQCKRWGWEGERHRAREQENHSTLCSSGRWTIWMRMRSIFSARLRIVSPGGDSAKSTRRVKGRPSSTRWSHTKRASSP